MPRISEGNENPRIYLKHLLNKHLPYITWGTVIILLISIPGNDLPEVTESVDHFQPDKLVHAVLFLVFLFLILRGYDDPAIDKEGLKNLSFYALFTGIFLGGATEIFQHLFIPGRTATLKDFLFNTIGCLLGWIIYENVQRRS